MKKLYTLPKMEKLTISQTDILTLSYIYDGKNHENIVRDPFAPAVAKATMN